MVRSITSDEFMNTYDIIGNGIQNAFYEDPNVLYISFHVYAGGRYYPGGDDGNWDHCGAGPGLGR